MAVILIDEVFRATNVGDDMIAVDVVVVDDLVRDC